MKEAKSLIGLIEIANPGIPSSITDPVSKTSETVRKNQDGVRRVNGDNDVGENMANSASNTDPSLSNPSMQCIVQNCC
jgi:hypothetical protein